MQNAKPGVVSAGHRNIVITDWKPLLKNTLCGFFTATLPSGMVIHNLTLHEKGEARWIGLPAKEWTNDKGEKQYARFIEFIDRPTENRFRDSLLAALDKHLAVAS